MEDLTRAYGNGEYYVIGFYEKYSYNSAYDVYVCVIGVDPEFGDEIPYVLDVAASVEDGIIRVSIADVKAALESYNAMYGTAYTVCTNMINVSLVPSGNDWTLDYAITFEPHILSYENTVTENEIHKGVTHSASCIECGETVVDSESCNFYYTHFNEYSNGNSVYGYIYTCRDCGFTYRVTYHEELTDATKCEYTRYATYSYGEISYDVVENVYENHSYSYTHSKIEEGNSYHTSTCTACGTESTGYCNFYSNKSENVEVDGVTHIIYNFYCGDCGYEYQEEHYTILTDASTCTYTQYYVYRWNKQADGSFAESHTSENSYTNHNYEYAHSGIVDNQSYHNLVCSACGVSETYNCSFYWYNSESYEENGTAHNVSYYRCNCGFEYSQDWMTVYTTPCEGQNFVIYTYNGQSVSVDQGNFKNHNHDYTYTVAEDGSIIANNSCSNCGTVIGSVTVTVPTCEGLVFVGEYNGDMYFELTPTKDGVYEISSSNNSNEYITVDPWVYVYEGDYQIMDNDDYGSLNFYVAPWLNANTVYRVIIDLRNVTGNGQLTVNVASPTEEDTSAGGDASTDDEISSSEGIDDPAYGEIAPSDGSYDFSYDASLDDATSCVTA